MKTSIYIATSLDGYIARENGDIDWLSPPPSTSETGQSASHGAEGNGAAAFQAFLNSVDAIVMGRNTYEQVIGFGSDMWAYGSTPLIVLSSHPDTVPISRDTVEAMKGTPPEVVKALSERGYEHLYVDGGNTIQGFLRSGLVDSLTIAVIPVLLGSGIALFRGALSEDVQLRLVRTGTLEGGIVQSEYEVKHKTKG